MKLFWHFFSKMCVFQTSFWGGVKTRLGLFWPGRALAGAILAGEKCHFFYTLEALIWIFSNNFEKKIWPGSVFLGRGRRRPAARIFSWPAARNFALAAGQNFFLAGGQNFFLAGGQKFCLGRRPDFCLGRRPDFCLGRRPDFCLGRR